MLSKPAVKPVQDVPPAEGFKFNPIVMNKRLPNRGPSGFIIFGTVLAMTVFGFYQLGKKNETSRNEHKEKRETRMAIVPYLMATQDRWVSEELKKSLEHEKEVMGDVKDWKVGEEIYSKRWKMPIHLSKNFSS